MIVMMLLMGGWSLHVNSADDKLVVYKSGVITGRSKNVRWCI